MLFDSVNAVIYNSLLQIGSISYQLPLTSTTYVFQVSDRSNPWSMAGVNAFAGVTTAIIDYPLDVLKTRIQIGAVDRLTYLHKTRSFVAVAKEIIVK